MRLVIFVPFIPGMHTIEVPWFTRPILVFPVVCRRIGYILFEVEQFLFFIEVSFGFLPI